MKSLFQWLVGSSYALYVLLFCFPYMWHLLYEEEIVQVLRYTGYGYSFPIPYIGYMFVALYGIASIGLVMFMDWARTGFLAVTILALVITPFTGLAITGWYESLLWTLVTMADGMIIALAYFSSIRNEFKVAS